MARQADALAEGVFFKLISRLVKGIEKAGSWLASLGLTYGKTFYHDLLEKEIQMVSLRPGDSVMHIGCGALPLTALKLAQKGLEVTAVDVDPEAVQRAERFLRRMGVGDAVQLQLADGANMAAEQFDAVWVSLHVVCKKEVVSNLLSGLRPGARLVYRNPRGLLSYLYPRVRPESIAAGHYSQTEVSLGKESILIFNGSKEEALNMSSKKSQAKHVSLEELAPDSTAFISATPQRSMFPPLGLRRGKKITVRCRHPLGGPLVVDVEGRRVALARKLARKIRVSREVRNEWRCRHQTVSAP